MIQRINSQEDARILHIMHQYCKLSVRLIHLIRKLSIYRHLHQNVNNGPKNGNKLSKIDF